MPENISKDNTSEIKTSLGQYFLQKKIAQGGMAEIFKGIASDIHGMKRTVVIKKILPHIAANKEFVDMLVSEAKIAVQLSHGNIAQIYDLGRAGQDYFMVMEFVDGKSLSQIHKRRVKEGGLIPLQYICYFVSEVANGLDYMHKKTDPAGQPLGIVHRDISPQNIIVSYSGTVKIIDFGIAKSAFKIDATESGVLKGKFAYMSPEQARGEAIDGRSDIFSLGVILHEILSGRRLFKDKDNKATIRNVRRAEIEPPSTYNPKIPKELDAIAMKALSKDADERYQEAGQMRDDLVKFLYSGFPDFKPASVVEFIQELFEGEMAEKEDGKEDENTPLLIVDQTQSAIDLSAPQVIKEFMLEEGKDAPAEDALQEISEEAKIKKPEWLASLEEWNKKKNEWLKRHKAAAFFIIAAAALTAAGFKFGWWREWAGFFKAEELNPKTAQTSAPAEEKYTTLDISSSPAGADIYIDDIKTKFKTPAAISDIRADRKSHTIGLFLENHKYFSTTFSAQPDDHIRFSPNLQPAYGELSVISDPLGARVFIDGEAVGTTPFAKEGIEPGTIFRIHIEKEGYAPLDEEVKISPNKISALRAVLFRLPKKRGEISIPAPKAPQEEEAKKGEEKKTETTEKPETEKKTEITDGQETERLAEPPEEKAPSAEPKSRATLTEIPLLPAEPIIPPQRREIEPESALQHKTESQEQQEHKTESEEQKTESVKRQETPEGDTGRPTPDSREKPLELEY